MRRLLILCFVTLAACNSNVPDETKTPKTHDHSDTMVQTESTKRINISGLHFADKKDLSCSMPLSAGVEDTVGVDGKLYGFCSLECKNDFLAHQKHK